METYRPTGATRDVPVITDRNVIMVELRGKSDEQGRIQFFAFWLDDNVGPHLDETGTRGQVFRTNVAQWIAQQGKRVEFI